MHSMSFAPRIGIALALCGVLTSGCARTGFEAAELDATVPPRVDSGSTEPPATDGGSISPSTGGGNSGADLDSGPRDSGPIFSTDAGNLDANVGFDGGSDSGSTTAGVTDSGSGHGDDAGPMFVCTAINTCATGRTLSTIRGDSEAQVSSASGQMSEWLAITIADIGGIYNQDNTLKARLTLTSPAGSNYDLFVHQPNEAGGNATPPKDCSVAPFSSQMTAGSDVVALSWQDVTNFFGETAGDGLTLSIEIRHVSGPCDKPWSLTVQGNTL